MALRVNTLSGNQLFNFANGMMRITVIAEKINQADANETRPLVIHSAEVAIPDSGIDLPLGTIKGINREINDVFNSRQDFATSTIGKQILTEKSVDISFAVDANMMLMDGSGSATVANNILFQMFTSGGYKLKSEAGIFENQYMYKVAGTNGTTKRSSQCKTDLDFKGLFWRDGMLAEPQAANELGELLLTENTRVTAYNNFNLCVMLEFIYKFSEAKVTGVRFPYCTCGEPSMTEGEDYNKFKFKSNLLSDSREINKSFIEGISKYEEQMYAKEIQYFTGHIDGLATSSNDLTNGNDTIGALRGIGADLTLADATGLKGLGVGIVTSEVEDIRRYVIDTATGKPKLPLELVTNVNQIKGKVGEVIFGNAVKYTMPDGTLVDYHTYITAPETSKLRHGQYVKIYVRGKYDQSVNSVNDSLDCVVDKTNGYILAKVEVDNNNGNIRRLMAVYPFVDKKGAQAANLVVTGSTSLIREAAVATCLIDVYDWDYDLGTMAKFTLDN